MIDMSKPDWFTDMVNKIMNDEENANRVHVTKDEIEDYGSGSEQNAHISLRIVGKDFPEFHFKMDLQEEIDHTPFPETATEILTDGVEPDEVRDIHHWFTIPTELVPYLDRIHPSKGIQHWTYNIHCTGDEEDGDLQVDPSLMDLYYFDHCCLKDGEVIYKQSEIFTLDDAIKEGEDILLTLAGIYIMLKKSNNQSAGKC